MRHKASRRTGKGGRITSGILALLTILCGWVSVSGADIGADGGFQLRKGPLPRNSMDLSRIPYKIVHETFRRTNGRQNWELHMMNADGTGAVNLTRTPNLDEMYAHVSPDGTRITFVVDEGARRQKVRSVYYMNIDGSDRVLVARNARQPCWSPDGKYIAYLEGEYEKYSTREYATSELVFCNIETGEHIPHVNKEIHHVYAICWVPGTQWFTGVVHGGMEYSDTILAFEVNGTRVVDLDRYGVFGCRPDLATDGKRMVWGQTDWDLCTGLMDVSGDRPKVTDVRKIVACDRSEKVYHVDISPDGRYITFSYGPVYGGQQVGGKASGWNICVGDLEGNWVQVTTNGNHNKEPDWVPISRSRTAQ